MIGLKCVLPSIDAFATVGVCMNKLSVPSYSRSSSVQGTTAD